MKIITSEAPAIAEKICRKCQNWQPLECFPSRKASLDGHRHECRSCTKSYMKSYGQKPEQREKRRQWKVAHPSSMSASRRKHARANKEAGRQSRHNWALRNQAKIKAYRRNRRALKKQASGLHTSAQWGQLCEKYKFQCLACGSRAALTADHIVPLSKFGSNDIENIQPLCVHCNSRKHDSIIDLRPDKSSLTNLGQKFLPRLVEVKP